MTEYRVTGTVTKQFFDVRDAETAIGQFKRDMLDQNSVLLVKDVSAEQVHRPLRWNELVDLVRMLRRRAQGGGGLGSVELAALLERFDATERQP